MDDIPARFARTKPRRMGLRGLLLLCSGIALGLVLLSAQTSENVLVAAPWAGLIAIMIIAWAVGRRQRATRDLVEQAADGVLLENWDRVAASLDRVLQRPINGPRTRGGAFLALAALAEHRGRHEAAAQIYETMNVRGIGDPVQLQQATIQLAAAKLRNEELADAVDLIGRLDRVVMPPPLRAAFALVQLFQQVLMGNFEDAAAGDAERRSLFRRHLSTRAGYGYGLLAAAKHHVGQLEEAAHYWADATCLIRPERIVDDLGILKPIAAAYPATERPL